MDEPTPPLPRLAGRILLVDDETAVLLLGQRLLAEIGCQVTPCQDPAEAMLATRPDLPILLLSGSGEEMTESPAACPGIREFLAKPIRLAELAEALGRYLSTA